MPRRPATNATRTHTRTSSRERAQKCEGCHNTNKWKPSLFDHEKTGFSLKGGHENVACGACHQLKKEVNGEQVLFYKPTPKACEACHSNGVPKLTTPGASIRSARPKTCTPREHLRSDEIEIRYRASRLQCFLKLNR